VSDDGALDRSYRIDVEAAGLADRPAETGIRMSADACREYRAEAAQYQVSCAGFDPRGHLSQLSGVQAAWFETRDGGRAPHHEGQTSSSERALRASRRMKDHGIL